MVGGRWKESNQVGIIFKEYPVLMLKKIALFSLTLAKYKTSKKALYVIKS